MEEEFASGGKKKEGEAKGGFSGEGVGGGGVAKLYSHKGRGSEKRKKRRFKEKGQIFFWRGQQIFRFDRRTKHLALKSLSKKGWEDGEGGE